jgi:hypothetical protein
MMAEHRLLLDAFAEARRSWDDLIALQPDVMAGSGHLQEGSLSEFERRVAAHREAIDYLADAFEAPSTGQRELPLPLDISREPFDTRDQFDEVDRRA